jgi:hypothetical protein
MEETSTLLDSDEALQPILQMAQESSNSNISTIRTVVLKALSDPKVFCGFDEIKQVLQPTLQSLGTTEAETILRTLDLFSYGTFQDYHKADKQQYLALSDAQIFKLRQLTVLTMVQQACSTTTTTKGCVVPYPTLAAQLGFDPHATPSSSSMLRQVEEVVLACVYARVLAGQLCQKSAALFVHSRNGPPCRPRDVPLTQGKLLLDILQQFHQSKLLTARAAQDAIQQSVQMQLDANRNYQKGVLERIQKAETTTTSGGNHPNNPAFIGGVRGWPADGQERLSDTMGGSGSGNRSSTSSRRQTKRSRGGVGGGMDAFSRY